MLNFQQSRSRYSSAFLKEIPGAHRFSPLYQAYTNPKISLTELAVQ